MKINDVLWLSYKDLSGKKVRTALTIIMVIIGVASIIALTSLTAGIGASITSSLQSLGPTSIIVTSTKATGFTIADTGAISTLPNVSTVIPVLRGSATFLSGNQNTTVTVYGVDPQFLDQLLGTVNMYQGAVYDNTPAPSSVIGHSVAFPTTAGGSQSAFIGQPATLQVSGRGTQTYTIPVVGILQPYGSSLISIDTSIVMSLQAAEELLHRPSFNTMLVKATNTSSVTALTNQISAVYGSSASVFSTQQLAQTAASIIGGISAFLLVVAGISLLVAAIGIMNIMLMSVMERTHEIGIMKSIGFKSRDVLVIFLTQAVMIGFIGGIIGIVFGTGVSFVLASASSSSPSPSSSSTSGGSAVAARGSGGGVFVRGGAASSSSSSSGFSFSPVLTVQTILTALLVAILVSVIAGIYPAWRASQMQPIDALRQL
ncbi:MAG: ABC transporter permease [Candidatus Micrarchaeota archaeon]|nr:ABC transporter permease [Candidatus Micrarchaeota archaeon]MDE1833902.1 ABC transporter permease [Candidatus Micrarchaeota archaeon]